MSADSESLESKRRRGIQASPTKLRRALVDSGLKTQLALADRIAELEKLDAPPRGLVNRIFKGESVDPSSLERVARALNVDAWALYRSSDEPAEPAIEPATEPDHRSRRLWGVLAALALLGLVVVYLGLRPSAEGSAAKPANTRAMSAAILLSGSGGEALESSLAEALNAHWRIVPRGASATDAQGLLATRDVDRVFELRTQPVGRWLGLTLYLHSAGSMRELWIGALRRSDGAATARRLFDSAATASNNTEPLERPAKREALDRYLNARLHVDAANLELNGRRALTDFSSAARLEPQWVDAYAGLCEALVLDNVRTGDAARLVEAEAECARALRLDANNLEARRAQAYLDRKRGQLDAAQRGFEQVLRDAPDNVDAMIGLAEVHITQFARGSDALLLDQAKSLLRRAEQIDPAFWKLPFTLARALYAGQDTRAAIASNRKAVDLDPNILALSNLGTYQFCAGDLTAARAAYEQARRSDPAAFVGSGQLGVIAYFQRDYTAAVAHLRHAIDLHEAGGKAGDHRLWSNYADALRRRGDREAALNAYSQAVTLAERDAAGGDGNPAHQSYLAFYYEMLARLDPERWSARRVSTAKLRELASSNDIFSLMYIASVHFQRGETEVANAIKSRAAGGCPGFAMSPDLQLR